MTMLQHGLVPSTGGYQIERSLRFNSADSAYLNRTFGTPTSQKTMTFSAWVKLSKLSNINTLLSSYSGTSWGHFVFDANNKLEIYSQTSGSANCVLVSTQVFRDPSAWGHLVIAIDTGQATSSNRVRAYWNGTEITAWGTATYPAQNADVQFQVASRSESIGRRADGGDATQDLGGYLADVYFVDGQQLTPSSFGETDTDTGVWKPKAYSGSYGTNGFYLKFADNSGTTSTTLGKDSSGNGNNWTPNNFSVTAGAGNDSLVDSPTAYGTDTGAGGEVRGNYATLNPLAKASTVALANGNLDFSSSAGNVWVSAVSTMPVSSGKWYAEFTPTVAGQVFCFGIIAASAANTVKFFESALGYGYYSDGSASYKFNNNTNGGSYGAAFGNGDVVGVALDLDAGTLVFYKNGVSQGTAYSSLSGTFVFAGAGFSNGSTPTYVSNFGQRPFAYTAPSGFKALCTQNLPTPTIGATATTRADDYFNTVLYTGNGAYPRSITGVGFSPDLVWIKSRSGSGRNQIINDSIRGSKNTIFSNLDLEAYTDRGVSTFDSDGFTIESATNQDETNANTETFVSWNWRGSDSAAASNTSGTITSTVSANATSGFSIVTYTGTGANATVGHGLGVAPSMIFVKRRNVANAWAVYHSALGAGAYLVLNTTAAAVTGNTDRWNNTSPTSSVFSVGTDASTNANTGTYVAYCFAPVASYSSFGSYVGNGSSDGPMIYTGFRPKWILIKRTSGTLDYWTIFDTVRSTYNVVDKGLFPNTNGSESSGSAYNNDFLSNGFKIRSSDTYYNSSGSTYIYAAFAENPFKYSLAR